MVAWNFFFQIKMGPHQVHTDQDPLGPRHGEHTESVDIQGANKTEQDQAEKHVDLHPLTRCRRPVADASA